MRGVGNVGKRKKHRSSRCLSELFIKRVLIYSIP